MGQLWDRVCKASCLEGMAAVKTGQAMADLEGDS